jgi:hypothetical protein
MVSSHATVAALLLPAATPTPSLFDGDCCAATSTATSAAALSTSHVSACCCLFSCRSLNAENAAMATTIATPTAAMAIMTVALTRLPALLRGVDDCPSALMPSPGVAVAEARSPPVPEPSSSSGLMGGGAAVGVTLAVTEGCGVDADALAVTDGDGVNDGVTDVPPGVAVGVTDCDGGGGV